MTETSRTELQHILLTHANKYPLMTPCDAVKLLYQNEFGGGHLIADRERAMAYLKAEYESTPHDPSFPLYEDIGNGIVRVNLAAVDPSECPLERLMDDFVRSAQLHTGSMDSFLEKLDILRMLSGQDVFSFSQDELDAYLQDYREAGCPMVSHSPQYRAAYHPSYRVVLKEVLA